MERVKDGLEGGELSLIPIRKGLKERNSQLQFPNAGNEQPT